MDNRGILSPYVHRLVKAIFLLSLFFGYYRVPKSEGGKFLGVWRGFSQHQQILWSGKNEGKKKSNPTIPFDKGQKTKQKSSKNHYLKISCVWKLYKIRTCYLQSRYRKQNILKTTGGNLLKNSRYTYNLVHNQYIDLQ